MVGDHELERTEIEALLETRARAGGGGTTPRSSTPSPTGSSGAVDQPGRPGPLGAPLRRPVARLGRKRQTALGIVSTVMGIPITAITLAVPPDGDTKLASLVVAWAGIVGVNIAHARQSRRR